MKATFGYLIFFFNFMQMIFCSALLCKRANWNGNEGTQSMHILTAAAELCTSRNSTKSHLQGRHRCPRGNIFLQDSVVAAIPQGIVKHWLQTEIQHWNFWFPAWENGWDSVSSSSRSHPTSPNPGDRSQHHQIPCDGGRALGILLSKHSIATGNPFQDWEKGSFLNSGDPV